MILKLKHMKTLGHEFLAFSYVLASVSLALLSLFFGFYLMKIIFV